MVVLGCGWVCGLGGLLGGFGCGVCVGLLGFEFVVDVL